MQRAAAWILTVIVAGGVGAWLAGMRAPRPERSLETAAPLHAAAARWVCPMHAEVAADAAGDCSICGMDLVPLREKASDDEPREATTVHVTPGMVHALGVRTVEAQRGDLSCILETVGYVEYDRTRLREIYPPTDGQIERLAVRSEGERVEKGQFLFQLFSPMLGASYDKTYAHQDGVVVALDVIEGSYVTQTTLVLKLADLGSVWVLADVFEDRAGWIRPGQAAEVRLPYVAGRVWRGRVEYVYPNLDPETRTLKVRLRFDNPDETLKPNMHAEVAIDCGKLEGVVSVPRDAVIETGHETRVILALGEGRFRPRRVALGRESGERVEVVDGLAPGDRVVVSAQFLIDSEASLRASLARLHAGAAEDGDEAAGHGADGD